MKEFPWLSQIRQERIANASRNPGLAALMSFFVMGLGQIYAGHIDRGIVLLVLQLSGMLGTYSIYHKGLLYDLLLGTFSPGLLIMLFYVCSVGLILLWIFNIKDAYYLSLFSGFRDWFEIEKSVIPLLANYKVQMLPDFTEPSKGHRPTHAPAQAHAHTQDPDQDDSIEIERISDIPNEFEEAVVKPIRRKKTGKKRREGYAQASRSSAPRPTESGPELLPPDTSFNLKFYGAVGLILLLGGMLAFRAVRRSEPRPEANSPLSLQREVSFARVTASEPTAVAPVLASPTAAGATLPVEITAAPEPATPPEPLRTPEEEIVLGMAQIKGGNWEAGAAHIETGLQSVEAKPDVWRTLLSAYKQLDNSQAYEEALNRYLQNYQVDTEGWIALGKVHFDRQEYVEASRALSKALRLTPQHPRANFYMGTMYRELGIPEDAIPCFEKALANDPLNPEFLRELGASYLDAKQFRQAKRFLERAINVSPQDDAAKGLLTQTEALLADAEIPEVATIVSPRPEALRPITVPETFTVTEDPPRARETPKSSGEEKHGGSTLLYAAPEAERAILRDRVQRAAAAGKSSRDSFSAEPVKIIPSPEPHPDQALIKVPKPVSPPEIIPTVTPKPVSPPEIVPIVTPKPVSPPEIIPTVTPKPVPPPKIVPIVTPKPEPTPLASKPVPLTLTPGRENVATPPSSDLQAKSKAKWEWRSSDNPSLFPPIIKPATGGVSIVTPPATPAKPSAIATGTARKPHPPEPLQFAVAAESVPAAKKAEARSVPPPGVPLLDEPAAVTPKPVKNGVTEDLQQVFETGRQKYLAGKWNEALPHFLAYLSKKEDPLVYEFTGDTFEKMGMVNDALEASKRAHDLGRKDSKMTAKIGILAEKSKKYKDGIPFLQKASKELPHRIDLQFHLLTCLRETGQTAAAAKLLQEISVKASGTYALQQRIEAERQALQPITPETPAGDVPR